MKHLMRRRPCPGLQASACNVCAMQACFAAFTLHQAITPQSDQARCMPCHMTCHVLQGLQGREDTTLILDDSPDRWPHHRPNLIRVSRYHYWQAGLPSYPRPGLDATGSLLVDQRDETVGADMMAMATSLVLRTRTRLLASARQASDSFTPLPWPDRDMCKALQLERYQVCHHHLTSDCYVCLT